jgi:hypothetical protein
MVLQVDFLVPLVLPEVLVLLLGKVAMAEGHILPLTMWGNTVMMDNRAVMAVMAVFLMIL